MALGAHRCQRRPPFRSPVDPGRLVTVPFRWFHGREKCPCLCGSGVVFLAPGLKRENSRRIMVKGLITHASAGSWVPTPGPESPGSAGRWSAAGAEAVAFAFSFLHTQSCGTISGLPLDDRNKQYIDKEEVSCVDASNRSRQCSYRLWSCFCSPLFMRRRARPY